MTVNGFPRGVPGFIVEENFKKMSEDEAARVCEVPLSHPLYLCSILFIWTLTCQVELRTIAETAVQMFWRTPTVKLASEVLEDGSEEHVVLVKGLTRAMKIVLSVFVFLPRFVSVACLLYLGCRWLTATLGLGDVLLNGVALEFMVLLKELLYKVCVSQHNRVSTQRLLIRPLNDEHHAHCCTFFSAQVWGLMSGFWALYYVFRFQMVLPDYRWDVGYLCDRFVKSAPMF
uniref:Uncharacterized protein n=1 Tax=Alexandrium catenella TaxID=2925 RepID=A0A7S1RJW5_ALECA